MAKKVVRLSVVRNKRVKENVKAVRDSMLLSAKESAASLGDDLAGFALVAWSKTDGEPCVSFNTNMGPIGPGLVVAFVSDALARRVTLSALSEGDGDEDMGEN